MKCLKSTDRHYSNRGAQKPEIHAPGRRFAAWDTLQGNGAWSKRLKILGEFVGDGLARFKKERCSISSAVVVNKQSGIDKQKRDLVQGKRISISRSMEQAIIIPTGS